MNEIVPFVEHSSWNFEQHTVRTVVIDGEPWFVAADVCEILGTETRDIRDRLDADEKGYVERIHLGLNPGKPMVTVNEAGLYTLIMRSSRDEAKRFRRWVTHEVLPPSVRPEST